MKYTLICLTNDGDQILCHGYDSMAHVLREIHERVHRSRSYAHVSAFQYRRYIVIGTHQGTDTVHVYNKDGIEVVQTMVAQLILSHAHDSRDENVIQFTLKREA